MKLKGKNIFLGSLLGVFCANVFLPLVLFVSIQIVKMEQREFIEENYEEESAFSEVIFSGEEFEKYRLAGEEEFELNGKMYDVHSVTKKDGKYIVKVRGDEKETGLKKIQNTTEKEQSSKPGVSFLPVLFFEKAADISFSNVAAPFYHTQLKQPLELVNVGIIPGPPPDAKA